LAVNETLTSLKLGSKRNKSKALETCSGEIIVAAKTTLTDQA
jgi:hypothetical protein